MPAGARAVVDLAPPVRRAGFARGGLRLPQLFVDGPASTGHACSARARLPGVEGDSHRGPHGHRAHADLARAENRPRRLTPVHGLDRDWAGRHHDRLFPAPRIDPSLRDEFRPAPGWFSGHCIDPADLFPGPAPGAGRRSRPANGPVARDGSRRDRVAVRSLRALFRADAHLDRLGRQSVHADSRVQVQRSGRDAAELLRHVARRHALETGRVDLHQPARRRVHGSTAVSPWCGPHRPPARPIQREVACHRGPDARSHWCDVRGDPPRAFRPGRGSRADVALAAPGLDRGPRPPPRRGLGPHVVSVRIARARGGPQPQ